MCIYIYHIQLYDYICIYFYFDVATFGEPQDSGEAEHLSTCAHLESLEAVKELRLLRTRCRKMGDSYCGLDLETKSTSRAMCLHILLGHGH